MMTAMFEIVEQHNIDPAQVRTLRIALSPPIFAMHGNFATYKGKSEALLSTHYVAAAILHDRQMTLAQFEPARYDDARLRQFAGQVEVRSLDELSGVQALVEIETMDGQTISARCDHPLGSPENRLSRAQVACKFRTYAKGRMPEAQVQEVIDAVVGLEHLGSVRTLMDLLREPPQCAAGERAPAAALARV